MPPGSAVDPARPLNHYTTRAWSAEHGLPHQSIEAIAQTPDGYLWLGTESGLARFDGVTFATFDRSNTPAFANNTVYSLLADRAGRLWVGTGGSGLLRYEGGAFTRLAAADGLAGDVVLALAEDRAGRLWVGTTAGLSRYADGRFTTYRVADGLPNDYVRTLWEDTAGRMWVGTGRGLACLADGRFTAYSTADGLPNDNIRAIRGDGAGGLWVGTNDERLVRFRDGRFTAHEVGPGVPNGFVRSLYADRDGSLWVGTSGGGLFRWADGRFAPPAPKGWLPSPSVVSLFEDRSGNLWAGTAAGLVRVSNGRCVTYTTADGLAGNMAWATLEDRSGNLWVASTGGLTRWAAGRTSTLTTADGLPSNNVLSLAEDAAGAVWVGTAGGLARYQDGRFTRYTTADGLARNVVLAVCPARDGDVWVGTGGGGLCRLRDGRFTTLTAGDGLTADLVRVLHEDRTGRLWVGTNGGGLTVLSGGTAVRHTTREGLSSDLVLCLHEDAAGAIWVGTHGGGLNRYRDGRWEQFTTRDGLPDDVVYQILGAGPDLWMSSNKGVFRVRADELRAGRAVRPLVLGRDDGLRFAECSGGSQPAGCRTRDGRLWFPTSEGVVAIDPDRARVNPVPPPLVIEQVTSDSGPLPTAGTVTLPPGQTRLEFRYSALELTAADRVRFRYRLDGFDPGWVDAGGRRTAYYTNLPPGRYRFQVAACNGDGVWVEEPAEVGLDLRPHFHQTAWFYVACGLTALLAAVAGHRLRVRGLTARQRELARRVDERTRTLAEREEFLRLLFRHIPCGVFWKDRDSVFRGCNDRIAAELGIPSPDAVAGLTDYDVCSDRAVADGYRADDRRVVATGEPLLNIERSFTRPDGSRATTLTSKVPLRDAAGAAVGVLAVCQDVTDHNRLVEQLHQSQKMEAVGLLAGGVAHDFNNLLTVISGYTDLLVCGAADDDPARGPLVAVQTAAKRAAALTGQLLAFSRKQVVEPRVVDVNRLVAEAETLLARLIGEDVALTVQLDLAVGPVRIDPGQFHQVVLNLAVNARDAMPAGGRLTIDTTRRVIVPPHGPGDPDVATGEYVELAVTDTGVGMDEPTRARVFEPFFTTKGPGHGTGLGLAVVHGIVQQAGGRATVQSAVGRGTTFRLLLPCVRDAAPADSIPPPPPAVRPEGGGETVLVVEDEPSVRALTRHVLESGGYAVLEAEDGLEAVRLAEGHRGAIDLLVSDVIMPHMGGREVAERLRQLHPGLRVLFVSGYTDDAVVRGGVLASQVDFLQKPFAPADLADKVRRVLGAARQ